MNINSEGEVTIPDLQMAMLINWLETVIFFCQEFFLMIWDHNVEML